VEIGVAVSVGLGVGVAVGTGVGVDVGVPGGVGVGVGLAVAVGGRGKAVGVGVWVGTGIAVAVAVKVAVGLAVGDSLGVRVDLEVRMDACLGVGVGENVEVDAGGAHSAPVSSSIATSVTAASGRAVGNGQNRGPEEDSPTVGLSLAVDRFPARRMSGGKRANPKVRRRAAAAEANTPASSNTHVSKELTLRSSCVRVFSRCPITSPARLP
jgi:hypothetical protein